MCTGKHICGERRRANVFCLHQTVYQSTYIDAIKLNFISCESMELVILTNFAWYVAALIEAIAIYLFHRNDCLPLMTASNSISVFRWNVPLPHRLTYIWNDGVCLSISFINFCMLAQRSEPSSSRSLLEFVNFSSRTL